MKKIIDGKLYDTATAEEIHDYSGFPKSLLATKLYRTKNDRFFLYQYGMMLPLGEPRIQPLTKKEALDWLETHDGEEALLSRFPDEVTEA